MCRFIVVCVVLIIACVKAYRHGDQPPAYKKIVEKCLRAGHNYEYYFPHDAEQHYQELMNATEKFRSHGAQNHLEHQFVTRFSKLPLSFFNGLMPIFVQWIDQYILHENDKVTEADLYADIKKLLRPYVLYIAVSQTNHGLRPLARLFPNVIVMSAGGEGSIALPLLQKNEVPYQTLTNEWQYDMAFFGTVDHGAVRMRALTNIQTVAKEKKLKTAMGPSKQWVKEMSRTIFNFAPRGYGRNSFRVTEIVQLGRIPVYIYDDFPWAPYAGSQYGLEEIGFISRVGNERALVNQLLQVDNATLTAKLQKVKEARKFFTFAGVLNQIELFFHDPLGPNGGQLSCTPIQISEESVLDIQLR